MSDFHFKTIGLIGRQEIAHIAETLSLVYEFLSRHNIVIILEEATASCLQNGHAAVQSSETFGKDCDLIIVVGGDGSLLHAARSALANDIPILGINRGRLGFLTDIAPDQLDPLLDDILAGQFAVEKRLLLETQLTDSKKTLYAEYAINDIVLKQGNVPNMLGFAIYIDDHCVSKERADGIIIATPTGSTAYALSGGGPILHSGLNAYLLLTMFSHTLSSRPMVIPGQSKTRLNINVDNATNATFRCDGLDMVDAPPGSQISIQAADKSLQLIHPRQYNYFDNLRGKLGWGQKAKGDLSA